MTPERQREPEEELSEEMLPTMYDHPPGTPAVLKPQTPVKSELTAATLRPSAPARPRPKSAAAAQSTAPAAPKSAASYTPKNAAQGAPVANDTATLSLIMKGAAILFALSIIAVAILYFTGKL
jgi:hypothetical protein